MLPVLVSKLGLPILVSVIGTALGRINNPVAQSASQSLENFEAALKSKEYETAISEVNQSLRTEISSADPYVRRMRPTFGYLLAFTWSLQMTGIAYVMVFETEKIENVLRGMEGLSAIWAVALSVLGIYVYKRSEEKKVFNLPLSTDAPKKTTVSVTKTTNITPPSKPPAYND